MTLSGPDAQRALDEALRDVRREEDEIARRLARSAELIGRTREAEAQLFRRLALTQLDRATAAALGDRLDVLTEAVEAEQRSRSAVLSAAERELAEADHNLADLAARRANLLRTAAQRHADFDGLRDRVVRRLAEDAGYRQKTGAAVALSATAAGSEEKMLQAERDREQRGRPYREDRLFMYLWGRGYGTPGYSANPLVRHLDDRVAKMVGYDRARSNFVMLNAIPLRLREHAERQAQLATVARREIDALEDAAIETAGGRPLREALAAADAAIAEVDLRLLITEDQRNDAATRLQQLAVSVDGQASPAQAALAEVLAGDEIGTLIEESQATGTGDVRALLTQLEAARARAAEEERDSSEQTQRLATLGQRRRALEDIQYEFRRARFDDPRSGFADERLAGEVLSEFLRGSIDPPTYWDRWRQSQIWTAARTGKPADAGLSRPRGLTADRPTSPERLETLGAA